MAKKKSRSKITKRSNVVSEASKKVGNDVVDPNIDILTSMCGTTNQVVFMKVCRLCESKDGPFLNIFDSEKITAKKIDELMPFGIAENDGLPHKICFRCSAKVEELYEFIQKCIKTQHSLREIMGIKGQLATKTKTIAIWEETLNKSNMSNDDICDALIKKAMEGIKDIPLELVPTEEKLTPTSKKVIPTPKKETSNNFEKKEDDEDLPLKDLKGSNIESKFLPTRSSRSQSATDKLLDGLPDPKRLKNASHIITKNAANDQNSEDTAHNNKKDINNFSFDYNDSEISQTSKESPKSVEKETAKPFNIMEYISKIRVNDVGVLFQCKLCNRNFLKKDVVLSHACAKTGVPKEDFTKNLVPPAPPKIPVVKYINTKIDDNTKKSIVENKSDTSGTESKKSIEAKSKEKPKIGPASKVKRQSNDCNSVIGMSVVPLDDEPAAKSTPPPPSAPVAEPDSAPSVQFPSAPSLNSRYKLLPGPNNTFQLVEEPTAAASTETVKTYPKPADPELAVTIPGKNTTKSGRKRKGTETKSVESKSTKSTNVSSKNKTTEIVSEVIDLEDPPAPPTNTENQPYPVGLFQTLPHRTEPSFTTPAMKKQSYTIVQTGNPSKLLISTKPQPVVEDVPKKRQRKTKVANKPEAQNPVVYSASPEESATSKDAGFFTFINVDPLLQPSYVLPTDNIIQESQISTSTTAKSGGDSKDKYSCNMCGENFTREKKLLSHIHSHYNKMDEEDQLRAEKSSRKRGKRN